jgi:D-xylose 1-dehydrogenase (NADP+, D-xylono-1,5-lactone-forming)
VNALRWGLLSTANIGATVVHATKSSVVTDFVAVASRDEKRARQFAGSIGLAESFGSYEGLLASDVVDAVYVALPPSLHTEWTVKALDAGKHVLCEKPFALTAADAAQAFDAADAAGRVCVEGFMYRLHPQTTLVRKLIEQGTIGSLLLVRAALSISAPVGDIRRSRVLGGGALNDLGCYCVSAVRLFAGEPGRVSAEAVHDDDGVDLQLAATMRLTGVRLAQFDIGLQHPRRDELELIGTDGKIIVSDPWVCRSDSIEVWRKGRSESLLVDPDNRFGITHEDDVYRIEFDAISEAILTGTGPAFGRDDAVAQARALEAVRLSAEQAEPVEIS